MVDKKMYAKKCRSIHGWYWIYTGLQWRLYICTEDYTWRYWRLNKKVKLYILVLIEQVRAEIYSDTEDNVGL